MGIFVYLKIMKRNVIHEDLREFWVQKLTPIQAKISFAFNEILILLFISMSATI